MFTSTPSRRSWAIRAVTSIFNRQKSLTRGERSRRRSSAIEELEDRALLATFTVTNTLDTGAGSLRAQIAAANGTAAVDDIVFDLPLGGPINITTEILIDAPLNILGEEINTGNSVTVAAAGTSRIFDIDATTVTIRDLGMTGGGGLTHDPDDDLLGSGGAIRNVGGTLDVVDSVLSANQAATFGGAIFSEGGSVTLSRTSILDNTSLIDGGGIHVQFGDHAILDSVIDGNSAARRGGGIRGRSPFGITGFLRTERSTISNNTSGEDGGGIYNSLTFLTADSTWSGNETIDGNGGAIYNNFFTEARNTTVSGNTAGDGGIFFGGGLGGGIYNQATLTSTNSTITQNIADNTAGGIRNFPGGGGAGPGTINLFNSIIAGNTLVDTTPSDIQGAGAAGVSQNNIVGDANSAAALLDGVQGNIVGVGGVGVIPTDDFLDPLLAINGGTTETHALIPRSIAVNAGDNNRAAQAGANRIPDIIGDDDAPISNDQRGADPFVRIHEDIVDIGAFEVQPFIVSTLIDGSDGDFSQGNFSLREAIEISNLSPNEDAIAFAIDDVFDPVIEMNGDTLFINTTITIQGRNTSGGGFVFVDGDADGRILWIDGITPAEPISVSLQDITFFNGHANGSDTDDATNTIGGAILNDGAELQLLNVGLHSNIADGSGGGIANIGGGELTAINTTVSGNTAVFQGGGVYSELSKLTGVNITVTGNNSSLTGGGITSSTDGFTETRLYNSLIAGNFTNGIAQDLAGKNVEPDAVNNLIGSAANAGGIPHGGVRANIVGNNGLGTIDVTTVLNTTAEKNGGASQTHALVADSPALDAGNNDFAVIPAFHTLPAEALISDGRNNPFQRAFNGTTDIGAYEDQVLNILVDTPLDELDADFSDLDFSLREAVLLANQNPGVDSIGFEELGTNPTVEVDSQVLITSSIVIDGSTIDGNVTLDGGRSGRILIVDETLTNKPIDTQISNVNFTRGDADGSDGGLTPDSGGAILLRSGALGITNAIFDDNDAADSGGAIYNEGGALSLTLSTFTNNTAGILGGGLANDDGSVDILTSTFFNNEADTNGGGIFNNNGPMTIVNSTVSGNSANIDGGGIYNEDDSVVLVNSSVVNNIADADGNGTGVGGGILTVDDVVTFTTMFNTLVAGNQVGAGNAPNDLGGKTPTAISSNNLIADAGSSAGLIDGVSGNVVGIGGAGTIPITSILNPVLSFNGGSVQTHQLAAGSAAINTGDANRAAMPGTNLVPDIAADGDVALVNDQRGFPYERVSGATVDIGAFEVISSWVVDTDTDIDDGDYTEGNLSLREAIFLANSNPSAVGIQFDIPVTDPTIVIGGELFIDTDIVVDGTNLNALGGSVTLDGGGAGRILKINGDLTPSEVGLMNLTFTGGNADGSDPAPFNLEGGAVFNLSGDVWVRDVTFTGNTADEGGAIMSRSGSLQVWDTAFTANDANSGAGLFSFGTTTTVIDSMFSGNDAAINGGAIVTRGGTTSVITSTIWNNSAANGGAAANEIAGNLHFTNSTISDNAATNDGGGIYNDSGFVVLTNATVTANFADDNADGAGLGGGLWTRASAGTRLYNTIVAGNEVADTSSIGASSPSDIAGLIVTSSNNLIGDAISAGGLTHGVNSNIVGNTGVGTIPISTVLDTSRALNGGAKTETHALVAGSPAIDAGDTNRAALPGANGIPDVSAEGDVALTFDQRATPHIRATGNVDIGAYEVTSDWLIGTNDDVVDGVFGSGSFSLREAVLTANANPGIDTLSFDIGLSRSTIELAGTELLVTEDLVINGLGAASLTLDAGGLSRILNIAPGVSVTLRNITLTGGTTTGAGGAILNQGTLIIEDAVLAGNTANNGGALMTEGTTTIKRTLFTDNTAVFGGAIDSDAGQQAVLLENVTVSGNTATGLSGGLAGAGIRIADAVFTITSSTIANNTSTAGGEGAGIAVDATSGEEGSATLTNSIVADNITAGVGVDIAGHFDELNSSLIETEAGFTDGSRPGTIFVDPQLEALAITNGQTATHQLAIGSPAINRGNDGAIVFGTDQTGQPRQVGQVDMGADERLLIAIDDIAETVAPNSVTVSVLNNDTPTSNVEIRGITTPVHNNLGSDPGTAVINGDTIDFTPADTGFVSFDYDIGIETQRESGTIDSEFGHSVSVDGDWMVVGAPSEDLPNADGGAVTIYRRAGGSWTLFQQLDAAEEDTLDRFGYDVAIDGTTIVVGARMDDDMGLNAGAAYVYEFDATQGVWLQSAKLLDTVTGSAKDQFGHSVAIDGDTIVIGARLDDGLGTNGGSIFVFNRSATGWTTTGAIKSSDQTGGDQFGYDVAIDGDTIAVGARKDDTGGIDSGSVYVFELDTATGSWDQTTEIISSTTRRNTWFGHSVSISGDTIAVGMPQRFTRFRVGEVHVLERDAGGTDSWGETALLVDPNENAETDHFGFAVAIDGDRLLIGSDEADNVANNAGMVYLHERAVGGADAWGQVSLLPAADGQAGDSYGRSLALDGDTFVIGASLTGVKQGSVYIEDRRVDTATVTIGVSAPLQATSTGSNATTDLTDDQLAPLVDAAREYWLNTDLTSEQQQALNQTSVTISSLSGQFLGLERGGSILIDTDAAGHGWYVDATPFDLNDDQIDNQMDLLSTLLHEMGHVIGETDTYDAAHSDDIMYGFMNAGESRTASFVDSADGSLDRVFEQLAFSAADDEFDMFGS